MFPKFRWLDQPPRREEAHVALDERSCMILHTLCRAQKPLPIEEISKQLHISKRTVYYDLEKINGWLENQGLAPVEHLRSSGLLMPVDSKKRVPVVMQNIDSLPYYTERERPAVLAISLVTSPYPLYLSDLMEIVRLSRATTFKELGKLKEQLLPYHVDIRFHAKKGYQLAGKEYDIRKAVVQFFSELTMRDGFSQLVDIRAQPPHGRLKPAKFAMEHPLFCEQNLTSVYDVINQCEGDLGISLTDEMMLQLTYRFLVFGQRIACGCMVDMDQAEREVLQSTREYQAATKIARQLEAIFSVTMPMDEIAYLTMNLLSAGVNAIRADMAQEADAAVLKRVISNMVDEFQRRACIHFANRPAMEEEMLLHLKPAFYRIKYGLNVQNPLTALIQEKYREIYELTRHVMHHFAEAVGQKIGADEIAYIAMHFGGWMKQQGAQPAPRKKALLVCGNGISTSRLVQTQLEALCPTLDIVGTVSRRDWETKSFAADLVVSTIPLDKRTIPVFIVSPLLTDSEKDALLSFINHSDPRQAKAGQVSVKALMELIRRHARIADEKALETELIQVLQHGRKQQPQPEQRDKPGILDLLTTRMVQTGSAADWREAIRIAAQPLVDKQYVEPRYVEAMIRHVEELGPYIIVAPQVAIPHGRPDEGVHRLGMSLLRLEQSVPFSPDHSHDVGLVIVIATVDQESHLKALSDLTRILSVKEQRAALLQATSVGDLLHLLDQYATAATDLQNPSGDGKP